jgi:hypothetical protein
LDNRSPFDFSPCLNKGFRLYKMSARHPDLFANRHIGPDDSSIAEMLNLLGLKSLDELVEKNRAGTDSHQTAIESAGRAR